MDRRQLMMAAGCLLVPSVSGCLDDRGADGGLLEVLLTTAPAQATVFDVSDQRVRTVDLIQDGLQQAATARTSVAEIEVTESGYDTVARTFSNLPWYERSGGSRSPSGTNVLVDLGPLRVSTSDTESGCMLLSSPRFVRNHCSSTRRATVASMAGVGVTTGQSGGTSSTPSATKSERRYCCASVPPKKNWSKPITGRLRSRRARRPCQRCGGRASRWRAASRRPTARVDPCCSSE